MSDQREPVVILLVEDEPADAHLVQVAFSENNLNVQLHHVIDGLEALSFLKREAPAYTDSPRPHLILLDLNMPRMDGREFLAAIKEMDEFALIPVVVLTTSDVERDVVSSYRLGTAGYIVKPVDMDEFVAAVRRLEDYWFGLSRLPTQR